MKIKDMPLFQDMPSEYRSFFAKQQIEYQYIRNKASSTMQIILAVISITISFGFVRFLFSGGAIQQVNIDISDTLVNRCAPRALSFSDPTIKGLGPTISLTAISILILSIYIIIEMWIANRAIQSYPTSLYPRNQVDLWNGNDQLWIKYNNNLIYDCRRLLTSIQIKLYYSLGLALTGIALLVLSYFDYSIAVFLLGLCLIVCGFFYISAYFEKYYLNKISPK